jgi:hypothetical protein
MGRREENEGWEALIGKPLRTREVFDDSFDEGAPAGARTAGARPAERTPADRNEPLGGGSATARPEEARSTRARPAWWEDDEEEPESKKTSITWRDLVKSAVMVLGLFGAGYVMRGYAEGANGTASLLGALRGRKDEPMPGGLPNMWGTGFGGMPAATPPSPEELAYWATYYKRGNETLQAITSNLVRVPTVEQEQLQPASPEERSAERAMLGALRSPPRRRYAWEGGYGSGGYGGGGYGGGYTPPELGPGGSDEEFTIVKEG